MVWLEVLRPGAIWPREIPAGALEELPVFRYRTALPAGGVPDDPEGGSAPVLSPGGGGFWSGLRRALGSPGEGYLLGRPPGERSAAAEAELRLLVDRAWSGSPSAREVLRLLVDWNGSGWLPESVRGLAVAELGRPGEESRRYARAMYECLRVVEQRLLESGRGLDVVDRVDDVVCWSLASVLVGRYGNLEDCVVESTWDRPFESRVGNHAREVRFGGSGGRNGSRG